MSLFSKCNMNRFALIGGLSLIILFFFQPVCINAPALIPYIRIGTVIAMAACFILYARRAGLELAGCLAIGYLLVMVLSCVVNGGSPFYTVLSYGPLAASILLARALIPDKKKELLWAVVVVTGTCTLVNLVVLSLVPIGTPVLRPNYDNTFLSYRNSFCLFYFPAITASLLLDDDSGKYASPRSLILYFAALMQSLISYSATSVFALLLYAVGMIIISFKKHRGIFNACTFAVGYLVLFASVVLFRAQAALSSLFGFMGRDVTFTGRTTIWDIALSCVDADHFLLGRNGIYDRVFVFPDGSSVGTAHNAILDVLVWGGVVGLIFFCGLIAVASVRLFRLRRLRSAAILSIYLGVFFLMGLVEFVTCTAFFLFIGIALSWRDGGDLRCCPTIV